MSIKWTQVASALAAVVGLTTAADAGLLDHLRGHGCNKSCGCASTCQPECCQPVIQKPCCYSVHTYQRQCSNVKPPCCTTSCCPTDGCGKCGSGCDTCGTKKCFGGKLFSRLCRKAKNLGGGSGCGSGCGDTCGKTCCDDPCEIAKLIYTSQTGCTGDERAAAISELGDYDCACHPEIMSAMIYALNDSDEDVREEAADEIGDMLSRNSCCCCKEVITALTNALGDCDAGVRDQAEEALRICGYEVVDCCEAKCCETGRCTTACGTMPAAPKQKMEKPMDGGSKGGKENAPPPPPAKKKTQDTYFPTTPGQTTSARPVRQNRLARLFRLGR